MTARTWTTRLAAMLTAELRSIEIDQAAVDLDGGVGTTAMTAILAAPRGLPRELEIGKWARHIAARSDSRFAFVLEPDMGREELHALVRLNELVAELRGCPRGWTEFA